MGDYLLPNTVQRALDSWGLGEAWPAFEAQNIVNPELVSKLTDFHLDKLFKTFDEAILFKENWKKLWAEKEKALHRAREAAGASKDTIKGLAHGFLLLEKINIHQIEQFVSSNWKCSRILDCYKRTKTIQNKHRNKVVEVIVGECLNIAVEGWSNNHFEKIAKGICEIFVGEKKETYYVPPVELAVSKTETSIPSSGKVPDKFKNELSEYRTLMGIKNSRKREEDTDGEEGQVSKKQKLADALTLVKEDVEWLDKNHAPLEAVVERWKKTSSYRRVYVLNNKNPQADVIFNDWPILKQPIAPTLIDIDFRSMKLTNFTLTVEKWEKFFTIVLNNRKLNGNDKVATDLLTKIADPNITADGRILAQLSLLPHLVTLKGTVAKSNKAKKGTGSAKSAKDLRGRSIAEVKDSIIVTVTTPAQITEIQVKKIAEVGRVIVQPYIIAVASTPIQPSAFYVSIKDYKYPVDSMLKALDIALKLYHVVDCHYPSISHHIWYLIQRGLYNFEVRGERPVSTLTPLLSTLTLQLGEIADSDDE